MQVPFSPLRICLFLLLLAASFNRIPAQQINADYEKFAVSENRYIHSGMAMSPDQQLMAIACTQGFPLYIYDYRTRKIIRQFDVGNWYAGARVSWSSKGRFLLLQQLYYLDFSPNRDREVNFEIIDATTGERVLRLEKYHDVKISPDEQLAVALTDDVLEIYNLKTGLITDRKTIKAATNSLEISPDGRYIAVSHRPSEAYLKNDPQLRKDPKALKSILKFKQLISVFNASDFSLVATVNDYYDNVYRLEWSADGKELYCLSIPYTKAATAVSGRQNFISVIDAVGFKSTRTVFPSNSNYEPAFRKSHDGKYMGVVSWSKFPELRIHDAATGNVLHRLEMSSRVLEGISKLDFPSDGRVFFEFLPGDKSILATFGNQLLLWNIPQD